MKFRIWNNKLRAFVSPSEYFVNGNGDVFFFDIMDGGLVKCDKCVVQYWSGRLDIHGKEIYEGDIVKHRYDGVGRVEILIRGNVGHIFKDDCGNYPFEDTFANEVIGNIFENSDLLK